MTTYNKRPFLLIILRTNPTNIKSYLINTVNVLFILLFISCSTKTTNTELKEGYWRGEISMQNKILPFIFEVEKNDSDYTINLINSEEILPLDNVLIKNDSLFFSLHIFDIDVKAKINDSNLEGVYIKNYIDNYELPFKATFNVNTRFDNPQSNSKFDGKWDISFKNKDGVINKGIGIFKTSDNKLKGTILTTTGDYRYLEGITTDNKFKLYSFDGNHAFIFEANLTDNQNLKGVFYSGKTFHESFTAIKNESIDLPDANELTFLKEGFDKIEFTFPDLNEKPVSLNNKKYQNKVIILQLFGTWCPNCMDETNFYSKWYNENKHRGVEIIGLAYEAKADFNYAKSRVKKMKERLNVNYDFLIAGTSNKKEASKTLPMLNHIMSFPTSIFIDKKGKVRKIHTGFSGPATGDYYLKYVDEFNYFMDKLLKEE